MQIKWFNLDLQLFGDGASGNAGAGAAGEGTGEGAEGAGKPEAAAPGRRAKPQNPLASVKYGIQAEEDEGEKEEAAAPEQSETDKTEEAEAKPETFEDLIKGRYRDDFNKRVQQVIDKRFSETKRLEAERSKLQPILTVLADKYGKKADDIQGIIDAVNADDDLYEARAMDRGMTAAQYRELMRVTAENQELRQRQQEQAQRIQADRILADWKAQADELKQTLYPGIDFDTEMMNPNVVRLLRAGERFRSAFEAAHMREIMEGTIGYAVQKTRENVTNNIRARQARPVENGVRNQATGTVKRHASELTKADRQEILRRVAAGEKVQF